MQVLKLGFKVGGAVFLLVFGIELLFVATGHGTIRKEKRPLTVSDAAFFAAITGFSWFLPTIVLGFASKSDRQ